MRFVLGILIVIAGVGLILKTEWVIQNFGTSSWAEGKFATSGGSRTLYKLIGLVLIFIGMLLATNLFDLFLGATVGKIFIREL
jgi:hypothetical protein